MLTRLAELCQFGAEAVATYTRNGLLGPVPPAELARMVEAYRHFHVTLATGVAVAAARWPDRTAVIDEDGSLTFAELDERAARLASALYHQAGVGPGRTVAVMWPNHRGFVEAVAAVSRLGADLLLVNTGLAGPQLRDVLRREGAHTLIAAPELPPVNFPTVRPDELTGTATGLSAAGTGSSAAGTGPSAGGTGPFTAAAGPSAAGTGLAGAEAEPPVPSRAGRLVLLTSGTTGAPKGATRRLSAGALAEPFTSMLATVPLRSGEPMLIAPPLFHGLGLLWYGVALVLGCPVVLMRRFDAGAVLRALAEHRAGALVAVPVMLRRLLAAGPRPLPHLRAVVSGGSALPPDLATAFMDGYGDVLHNLYGSTEAGWVTLATPADLRAAPDTIGRPTRGATVVIAGEDGRERPAGEVGRVLVGGGLTFGGYSGGREQPQENPGGLLATGDLGHRDPGGLLFIDGREDDMIVSGGENVFPQEVENLLARHPGVADVAVLGMPDEEYGQRLAAYVVPEPGVTLSPDEIRQAVKTELAGFKAPRDVEFIESVPRNQAGKVDRARLTEPRRKT
ncbi:AMP-binding protein [Nonomuraea rhizosphaerae]|uniref:AMP-binding protein n=1 Tax=Nonomuraea rhizosphaerae TaxID=2665663 RepID=UPI001C5E4A92|nr:AMP-binding protein [Nonomuraea rhizosphaerae]